MEKRKKGKKRKNWFLTSDKKWNKMNKSGEK